MCPDWPIGDIKGNIFRHEVPIRGGGVRGPPIFIFIFGGTQNYYCFYYTGDLDPCQCVGP